MKAVPAIAVSGLSFRYEGADHWVLQDISLDIPPGQVTAILGPNGSGKTTLLRLLLGVLIPQQGNIWIAGRPQHSLSRQDRGRWFGLVPQDERVPFDYSVLEFVLLGRAPYLGPLQMPGAEDLAIAWESLRTVGLEHLARRPVPTLSAGERQLATVARALAQQSRILLLDEPTAHLDLSNRGRLLHIIGTLAHGGVTVVFTTHDPNLAANSAHLAVLMRLGRVQDCGPAASTLTADKLSLTYGVPVRVLEVDAQRVIWLP